MFFSNKAPEHPFPSGSCDPSGNAKSTSRRLSILGTRGVPAQHGGFETFADAFSQYLSRRGWKVNVYCQTRGKGPIREDDWMGVHRFLVPANGDSPLASMFFDLRCVLHARRQGVPCLTLGYNTAIFNLLLKMAGIPTLMNMDGIEWSRAKWSVPARAWLYLNELAGAWVSDHLIADHPQIALHLQRHTRPDRITMIPYGAEIPALPSSGHLDAFGVDPGRYALLVARPEPENSILEIVRSWSRCSRGMKLLVLGKYLPNESLYHQQILAQASSEVLFPGAIYDKDRLQALRWHAAFYMHGHRVGGTNPSLVEALASRNPVIAHDNRFNRWVAGNAGDFFSDEVECDLRIKEMIGDPSLRDRLSQNAQIRHRELFRIEKIHEAYEGTCIDVCAARS